jgi:hypothetical protein
VHGIESNGTACVEPIKCDACDGFGHIYTTTKENSMLTPQEVESHLRELLTRALQHMNSGPGGNAELNYDIRHALATPPQFMPAGAECLGRLE